MALCLCFALAAPAWATEENLNANANMEDTTADNQVRMIDIENQIIDYLAEYHPDITFGSQEFVEYAVNVLMFNDDSNLAALNNYDDIRFYFSEYLYQLDQAQSVQNNSIKAVSSVLFDMPNEYKNRTLDDVIYEADLRLQRDQDLYENDHNNIAPLASSYNANAAARYATTFSELPNRAEYDVFSKDCTNFVSQALFAGGISMTMPNNVAMVTKDTTDYWYSKKFDLDEYSYVFGESSSWIRVEDLYTYMWKKNLVKVLICSDVSALQNSAQIGDVVQIKDAAHGYYYHSIIITGGTKGNYKYCGHTNSANNKPISGISGNAFRILRPIC